MIILYEQDSKTLQDVVDLLKELFLQMGKGGPLPPPSTCREAAEAMDRLKTLLNEAAV